jgi:hypothetical protein
VIGISLIEILFPAPGMKLGEFGLHPFLVFEVCTVERFRELGVDAFIPLFLRLPPGEFFFLFQFVESRNIEIKFASFINGSRFESFFQSRLHST